MMRDPPSLESNWSQGAAHTEEWRNSFPDRPAVALDENVPGVFQE